MSESKMPKLSDVYKQFCAFGAGRASTSAKGPAAEEMDNVKFAKMCKETGVIGFDGIDRTRVDLAFSKCKTKGKRKITFKEFQKALTELVKGDDEALKKLKDLIRTSGGPKSSGTKADDVRLAKEEEFVGVAARGGPDTKSGVIHDTSAILDRSSSDARGRKVGQKMDDRGTKKASSPTRKRSTSKGAAVKRASSKGKHKRKVSVPRVASLTDIQTDEKEPATKLKDAFMTFCRFGDKDNKGEMTSRNFVKMCVDTGIVKDSDRFAKNELDLIFKTSKEKTKRTLNFAAFKKALDKVAGKFYPEMGEKERNKKVRVTVRSGGPHAHGTVADDVRLAREEEFVGVHTRGGPDTKADPGAVHDISETLDRSAADARGVKKK